MIEGTLVTVFGGSGFLGRHIVKRLAEAGVRVRVAVRHPNAALFLKPLGDVGQIVPFATNIRDDAQVAAAVAGAQGVINLVGILFERGRQRFQDIHADGARRVAEACATAGVERLVQVSAIGADAKSESVYARTKAAGEAAARQAFPDVTIVRPSVVFGPDDDFLNRFASMARLSPALPLFGGGKTRFQPVYVGDVAAAIFRVLDDADTKRRIYELGGPKTMSLRDVFALVAKETRRRRFLVPLPMWMAEINAAFLQWLPKPPLTPDQVTLLRRDNVAARKAPGLAELGISPTPIEAIAASYLSRYRRGSRFSKTPSAGAG
jgi:NADH dehydrogenase